MLPAESRKNMRQEIDSNTKARLAVDDNNRVRQIIHLEQPWMSAETSPLLAAVDYMRHMDLLRVAETELANPLEKVSFTEPREQGIEYRLGGVKTLFDTSTIIFNQTCLNVPVWRAAITLTIKHNPNRIISATDTASITCRRKCPHSTRSPSTGQSSPSPRLIDACACSA